MRAREGVGASSCCRLGLLLVWGFLLLPLELKRSGVTADLTAGAGTEGTDDRRPPPLTGA